MATAAARKEQNESQQQIQPIQETLIGTVNRRIFYAADTGFAVLSVDVDYTVMTENVKMSGNISNVREGDQYRFTGAFSNHAKYGQTFKFTSAELILPTGTQGVSKYLSSIVAGVGSAKAQKIVDALGEDCLAKIKDFPEVLNQLDFLTETQRNLIAEDLSKNSIQAELAGMICREGVGMGTVMKIYNKYGSDAVKVVKEDPYALTSDIFGIGFKTADEIARTVGIAPNAPTRIKAAIMYVLSETASEGHTFLQPNDIVRKMIGRKGIVEASGVEVGDIARENGKLIAEGICIREGDAVYLKDLHIAECAVGKTLQRLLEFSAKIPNTEIWKANCLKMIESIEQRDGIEYAPEQKEAVYTALTYAVSVLTGGPGTGKTTVINTICDIYKTIHPHNYLYLAAPTGRAAKRMSEATNNPAKTIHRLLRYSPKNGGFEYGYGNPLPGPGLLIVDEASMIDIRLMADLMAAIDNLQVIFVGDIDQLPSVGPGSVLRDMISCNQIPTVRLKFNYRQAGGSKIAEYANLICQGETPPLHSINDFEYIPVETGDQAAEVILGLVRGLAAEGRSPMLYQILCPMHRFKSGVTELNKAIREIVNPPTQEKPMLGNFRLKDKVLVTKNDYELGIFNGNLGVITNIERGITTINFGDFTQDFTVEQLDILTLAYAMTIHKSQGSEFETVIMPMTTQHFIMLQRNLLYTGITRAKKRLILIANEQGIKQAIMNNKIEDRYSLLAQRIKEGRRDTMSDETLANNGSDPADVQEVPINEIKSEDIDEETNEE